MYGDHTMEMEGYEVSTATSKEEAMSVIASDVYPIVLVDLDMTDGMEIINNIRRMNTDSQILTMTEHASLDIAVKTIQEFVCDFLIKPVDFNYLRSTVKRAEEKFRLEQENEKLLNTLKVQNKELEKINNMKFKSLLKANNELSNALMALKTELEMLASEINSEHKYKEKMNKIIKKFEQAEIASKNIERLLKD